jgi:hypothetical protein
MVTGTVGAEPTAPGTFFAPKSEEQQVYDQFEKWIETTEAVLADEFEYKKSPYKNKRLALLDLRDKFLKAFFELMMLQRIERPSQNLDVDSENVDRLDRLSHAHFWDSWTSLASVTSCLFFADARDHGDDSYVKIYSQKILPCAQEFILQYEDQSQDARRYQREASLRAHDPHRMQRAEELVTYRDRVISPLADSDLLFPKLDAKKKADREEIIYVLEYLVINHSLESGDLLLEWSLKQGRFPLVHDWETTKYLREVLKSFFIRFVQHGGPHDDLESLQEHALEVVDIARSLMAR